MKSIFDRLRALPLRTHKTISFLSILGCSILGWILTQISSHTNFALIICFIGLTGGIIWHIVFVRCPHCGHHFNLRTAISNFCPECGEKLE